MTHEQTAKKALGYFEAATRKNGEAFWRLANDAPEWVKTMVQDAHGDHLPDDYRYNFIVSALYSIEEGIDSHCEPEMYTAQLTAWLASSVQRIAYLDQAIEHFGEIESAFTLLQNAQYLEMREVFDVVSYHVGKEAANQESA